ncbi:HlyD family efflux transporter periplasmic adaptor subunit [Thermosynechococcaceae cyanobacterium Okahandja]
MKRPPLVPDTSGSAQPDTSLTGSSSQVIPTQPLKLRRSLLANTLVMATGLGILAFTGIFLFHHLTSVRSRDAVVNGIITNVRAPEEGTLVEIRAQVGDFIHPLDGPVAVLNNAHVSTAGVKNIETWLQSRRGELGAAKAKLAQLQSLLASAAADSTHQQRLEITQSDRRVAAAKAELAAAQANLADAKARHELAKINYQRFSSLAQQGAVAQSQADAARTELQQSQAQVRHHQRTVEAAARTVEALAAEARAAQLGLTLRNTRSNYDPRLRLQELRMQIAEQAAIVSGIEAEIATKVQELAAAQQEVAQRQVVPVEAPVAGYVWHVDAQPGTFLGKGDAILQMLDCQRRWVDVFVDEQSLRLIHPGTKATIEPYGANKRVFRGTVVNIRSGLGRLNPGNDTALPIPENYPRQSQVRVEFDSSEHLGEGNFCYVGYTARVTFDLRSSP